MAILLKNCVAVVMGDLVEFFQAQGQAMDKMEASSPGSLLDINYTSCIRVNGLPILPPVLTPKRRSEMKALRREAMKMENKRKSRKSEKLLIKVQSIVAGVEKEYCLKRRTRLPRTSGIARLLEQRAEKSVSSSPTTDSKTDALDITKHSKPDNIRSDQVAKYTGSANLTTSERIKNSQQSTISKAASGTKRQLPQQPKPKTSDTTIDVIANIPTPPRETKHRHDRVLNTKFGVFDQRRAARFCLQSLSKRSVSQPDLRELNRENVATMSNVKNISHSEMDLSYKGTEHLDICEKSTRHATEYSKMEAKGNKHISGASSGFTVENTAEEVCLTPEFGTSTASDFTSLEDCNSLPQDLNGMPFTSVRQQQISHVLSKLSKVLNIQDTLSSTLGSITATQDEGSQKDVSNELSATPSRPTAFKKESDLDKVSSNTDSKSTSFSSTAPKTSPSSGNSSIICLTSPARGSSVIDIPNTVSNSIPSSSGNTSENSSKNRMSPTASLVSCGSIDQPRGQRASPKNSKNTVHFSSFVTEISTSASQSVEDKISVRKLHITPTSSIQFTEDNRPFWVYSDLAEQSGFKSISELATKNASGPDNFLLNDGSSRVDCLTDSMLSRVTLSPEGDLPDANQHVFFGSINANNLPFDTYSSEGEPNSSDKENMEFGAVLPGLHSTNFQRQHVPVQRHDQSQFRYHQKDVITASQSVGNLSAVTDCRSQNDLPQTFSITNHAARTKEISTTGTRGISVKSSIKSQSTESESSTLKGSQDHLSSDAYRSQQNIPVRETTGYSDNSTTLTAVNHSGVRTIKSPKNVVNNLIQSRSPELNTEAFSPENDIMQEVKHIKNPVRRGTYTQDHPSPSLLGSVAQRPDNDRVAVDERADSDIGSSASKPVHTDCDVEFEDGDEEQKTSQRVLDVYAEKAAKAAHIQRYLSQIQEQEHSPQISSHEPTRSKNSSKIRSTKISNVTDITATIQSFTDSLTSMQHLSEEQLLCLQAEHFETLRKSLIEQQKQQLEELFVQQRKEQLHLQSDITEYHHHIKEQQSMLKSSDEHMGSSEIFTSKQNNLSAESRYSQKSNNQFSHVPSPNPYIQSHDDRSHSTPKQSTFFDPSPQQRKSRHPVLRSPMKAATYSRTVTVFVPERAYDPDMQMKYAMVSACVKGYLTRRLLETEKVQNIRKIIKDTRAFATNFQSETPLRKGNYTQQDLNLLERIIAQLQAALLDIHEIFFIMPISERMAVISHSRQLHHDKEYKTGEQTSFGSGSQQRISSATQKAIARKKRALEAESAVFGDIRPSSAPPATSGPRIGNYAKDLRALRPIQGQGQGKISTIHPDGSSRLTSRKERPKTAPEKGSALIKPSSTSNILGRQAKPSNLKPRVTSSRVGMAKTGKSWR